MSRPRQYATAHVPVTVVLDITATEPPTFDATWSRVQPLQCEVGDLCVRALGTRHTATFFERVLSSLPSNITRLRLESTARLAYPSGDTPTFERLVVFHYHVDPSDDPSDSSDLFRILHFMPNLEDLTLVHVPTELQGSVSTPPFSRLRSYAYHSGFSPCPHWHLPILNSFGMLKSLSLVFIAAPPAASLLAAAEIIGSSLEYLVLNVIGTPVLSIAGVLVRRCTRLRELTINAALTNVEAWTFMDMFVSEAPLRRLSISMSLALVNMLCRVLETGIHTPLRALRELSPLALWRDLAASDQLSQLVRICAQRKVQFDTSCRRVE